MPLVSVLLPVYNAMPYLHEALSSLLRQTLTDIEIIALDDASSDGSAEYLDSIQDPRLQVLHLPKRPYSEHLNLGINTARSNLIARMDADDISAPDRLEKQYYFLTENPDYVACGCRFRKIDSSGKHVSDVDYEQSDTWIRFQLLTSSPLPHPGTMYRRDAALKCGSYDSALEPAEDYDLWCRLSREGRMTNLNEYLLSYRVHSTCVSVIKRQQQLSATRLISIRYLLGSGFAKSATEAGAFFDFATHGTIADLVTNATAFVQVLKRFFRSVRTRQERELLDQLKQTARWRVLESSGQLSWCRLDRYRLLALAWEIDPHWNPMLATVRRLMGRVFCGSQPSRFRQQPT